MNLEDLILVSIDDHAIEPAGAFAPHMPAKFKGREPHIETKNGRDVWVFEGRTTGYMGLNAVVGRPKTEYGMEPLGYEHMRRGTWDIKARVDDMDANGILGSICFPTFPGFAGQRFQTVDNREIALAAIQRVVIAHANRSAVGNKAVIARATDEHIGCGIARQVRVARSCEGQVFDIGQRRHQHDAGHAAENNANDPGEHLGMRPFAGFLRPQCAPAYLQKRLKFRMFY